MPLLDLLRTVDLVTSEELDQAAAVSEKSGIGLARALVQGTDVAPDALAGFLHEVLGIERIFGPQLEPHPALLSRVPLEVLLKGRALVVIDAPGVRLAMSDPTDQGVQETVAELFGEPLPVVLVDEHSLSEALSALAVDDNTTARPAAVTATGTAEGALFSAPLEAAATTIDVRRPTFDVPSLAALTEGSTGQTSSKAPAADATVVEKNPFLRSGGTSHSDEGR